MPSAEGTDEGADGAAAAGNEASSSPTKNFRSIYHPESERRLSVIHAKDRSYITECVPTSELKSGRKQWVQSKCKEMRSICEHILNAIESDGLSREGAIELRDQLEERFASSR